MLFEPHQRYSSNIIKDVFWLITEALWLIDGAIQLISSALRLINGVLPTSSVVSFEPNQWCPSNLINGALRT